MEILERFKTGNKTSIKGKIQKSIVWHCEHYDVKVGITSNPRARASSYRSSGSYDKMVILYETTSEKEIRELEKYLVEKNWEIVNNEIGGGGGPLGKAPHFLYIICKERTSWTGQLVQAAMIFGGVFLGIKLLTGINKSN